MRSGGLDLRTGDARTRSCLNGEKSMRRRNPRLSLEVAIPRKSNKPVEGWHPAARKLVRSGVNNLGMVQITPHMTRHPHQRASRLVFASLVGWKPGILHPGFVGMRGQRSDQGMIHHEYTPRPPARMSQLTVAAECFWG